MKPLKNAQDMAKKPFGRILITNDDGYDAPGLAELEAVARRLSDDIWVFAPDGNRSGSGRSLTISREVKVNEHGDNRRSCDGTPTDCMVLALNEFMLDCMPDLVLSGINMGMNVSDDITCSGTIGAAWEAVVHGVPSIALSQRTDHKKMKEKKDFDPFDAARHYAEDVIRLLAHRGWPEHVIMNVNFPSIYADEIKGIKAVQVGRHKETDKVDHDRGKDGYYRIGMWRLRDDLDPQSDIGALFDGYIAVCPLSINMTDQDVRSSLEQLGEITLPSSGRRSA
jgi:5'-nucleotidase